jgi:hypothetical protein
MKHAISPRKLYAMQRMSTALKRAAAARPFGAATDQALRWAAAWGMCAGIRAPYTPPAHTARHPVRRLLTRSAHA